LESDPFEIRNNLIQKARDGELTGDQADAEAKRLGLGSLSKEPGPDKYLPEAEGQWTLVMTIAWIAYRDLDEVRNWSRAYREECWDWHWREWRVGFEGPINSGWFLEQRSKPTLSMLDISSGLDQIEDARSIAMSTGQAQVALWAALREGLIKASGIDSITGRRVEIAALDWHELVAVQGQNESDEVRRGCWGTASERY
jgi:hypothetical protein